MTVIVFSSTFVLNIALNNYSLSIVSLSINLIIRSCLPLSTYISQTLFGSWAGVDVRRASPLEMLLMVLGTFCAVVAVYAKSQSKQDGASDNLFLGVFVCVMSLFSGSMNLALAGLLGSKAELNALDTTLYMAVPAVIFLLGPIFLMRHPVEWPNQGNVTDWEIVLRVWSLRPTMMLLVVLSGVFSSFYNVLQYSIVQSLSAAYTAFCRELQQGCYHRHRADAGGWILSREARGAISCCSLCAGTLGVSRYTVLWFHVQVRLDRTRSTTRSSSLRHGAKTKFSDF